MPIYKCISNFDKREKVIKESNKYNPKKKML